MSSFVDFFLKPFATSLPSYVRDSMDMINILKSVNDLNDNNYILATLDIENLFTNVDHEGGLYALTHFLDQRSDELPSTQCIRELAEVVLKKNAFMFETNYYLQCKGTSMGSKMSPQFSSLYVAMFENEFVLNSDRNPFFHQVKLWKRYVDDVFVIWQGTTDTLLDFYNYLNNSHAHLKFTIAHNTQEISFLDILIKRDGNSFATDLYRKKTDTCSYLHGDSFHPSHLKRSLPISQFSRIRRICSSQTDFTKRADELESNFRGKGYPQHWINKAKQRYTQMTQEECLRPNMKTNKDTSTCCFLTFSPLGKKFEDIIKSHWHILDTDPNLSKIFTEPPRVVYKRPPNIRQTLVKSELPPLRQGTFLDDLLPEGNYRCGSCTQCQFTKKCTTYQHPHTGQTIKIKGTITCSQKNIIYMLTCPCNLAYVGKTTRSLKIRIAEHRSSIRTKDQRSPVASHFMEAGHSVSTLRYIGIEHVKKPRRGGNIDTLLLRRESFHIHKLDTMHPRGLN